MKAVDFTITIANENAINILKIAGYDTNINSPSRQNAESTTFTIYKDGEKIEFGSSTNMLTPEYAINFLQKKAFYKGYKKGKSDLQDALKNLLSI